MVACLVGSVGVVVLLVLGQDAPEVLFAVNQQMIEALAAQRSHESLSEGIRPG